MKNKEPHIDIAALKQYQMKEKQFEEGNKNKIETSWWKSWSNKREDNWEEKVTDKRECVKISNNSANIILPAYGLSQGLSQLWWHQIVSLMSEKHDLMTLLNIKPLFR